MTRRSHTAARRVSLCADCGLVAPPAIAPAGFEQGTRFALSAENAGQGYDAAMLADPKPTLGNHRLRIEKRIAELSCLLDSANAPEARHIHVRCGHTNPPPHHSLSNERATRFAVLVNPP